MNGQFFNTLVPALLHTLWIGLVVSAILFLALRKVAVGNARFRYALGIVALVAVFVGCLVAWELPNARPEISPVVALKVNPMDPSNPSYKLQPSAPSILPEAQTTNLQPQTTNWHLWVGIVWMAGAVISLLRLVRISFDIQQLVRRSRVVDHPVAIRLVAELSRIAGTSRRILLLTGEHVVQPAVAGIFRSAIFLPLSVITGLPEWQLRAILAHELAHIVRHDFLVNALQLLAETLLFFNPAVWWINRRIREEREACCDALAAKWIDNNHELAETLIEQATFETSALPAFGDSNPGTLKSRILRLINPSQQPSLKLPWKSLLLVALIAVGGLVVAKKGTSEVVGYLKRLQTLELARDQFETPVQKILRESGPSRDKMFMELTINTEDGEPLPLPINISCWSRGGSHGHGSWLTKNDITEQVSPEKATFRFLFDSSITEYGHIETFSLLAPGYTQFAGTGGGADSNGVIRPSPVVLSRGYEGVVRFLDTQGNPVSGFEVNVTHVAGSSYGDPAESDNRPDQNGMLKVKHCSEHSFHLTLYPPDGFAYDQGKRVFKPNQIMEWTLKPAQKFYGTVVDPNGLPVKGAKVRIFGNDHISLLRIPGKPIEAVTDEQGRFSFSRMLPKEKYTLAIEADGYFGKFVKSLTLSGRGKRIILNPGGKLIVLFKEIDAGKHFYSKQSYTYVKDAGGQGTAPVPNEWIRKVSKTSTEAIYEFTHIWEGKNYISTDGVSYPIDAPFTNDTIALNVAQLREQKKRSEIIPIPFQLVLHLIPPKNEPMPSGVVRIKYRQGRGEKTKTYTIPDNGTISDELKMNANSRMEVIADRIPGYFIGQSFLASKATLDIDCHIMPAGAAALTCVDEQGYPVTGYRVHVDSRGGSFNNRGGDLRQISSGQTDKNTCMVESLDFKSEFKVRIYKYRPKEEDGTLEYESGWFSVSKSRPVKRLKCVLKPVE